MTQTIALGEIVETAESGFASGENLRHGVAQVRMHNVSKDGELEWAEIRRVPATPGKVAQFSLLPGDIVFNATNSPELVGKSALFTGFSEPVVFSNHFLRIRVRRKDVDPAYVAYWLHYCWRRGDLQRLATRWVNQAAIRKDDLFEQELVLPSLGQQQRASARLDQTRGLRRTRRYALQLCGELLPAGFAQLLEKHKDDCNVAELGDFIDFVTSGSRGWAQYYARMGARFIRSLDVQMNYVSNSDAVFVQAPQNAEADRTRVRAGDVLLTITGSRIGRVAPTPARLAGGYISQHVAIIRLNSELHSRYLAAYLSLENFGQREIARLQYGQTKPGLNLDQIREMKVIVPTPALQKEFILVLDAQERLQAAQAEAARQADHLFQTLLHQAFA